MKIDENIKWVRFFLNFQRSQEYDDVSVHYEEVKIVKRPKRITTTKISNELQEQQEEMELHSAEIQVNLIQELFC